jgi:hypothetical protein
MARVLKKRIIFVPESAPSRIVKQEKGIAENEKNLGKG